MVRQGQRSEILTGKDGTMIFSGAGTKGEFKFAFFQDENLEELIGYTGLITDRWGSDRQPELRFDLQGESLIRMNMAS